MVKKWKVKIPELSGEKERRAYIFLPSSYNQEPKRRYPVMYMFDGHNVFFDTDATYGKSWGMNKYMLESKKQLIIVAVECNHEGNSRLEEYSPFDSVEWSLILNFMLLQFIPCFSYLNTKIYANGNNRE